MVSRQSRNDLIGSASRPQYHTGTLLAMMLLVLLAVSTLSHWDAGGQPVTSYFHRPETVGIRHRYLIWGLALATALATVNRRLLLL